MANNGSKVTKRLFFLVQVRRWEVPKFSGVLKRLEVIILQYGGLCHILYDLVLELPWRIYLGKIMECVPCFLYVFLSKKQAGS